MSLTMCLPVPILPSTEFEKFKFREDKSIFFSDSDRQASEPVRFGTATSGGAAPNIGQPGVDQLPKRTNQTITVLSSNVGCHMVMHEKVPKVIINFDKF